MDGNIIEALPSRNLNVNPHLCTGVLVIQKLGHHPEFSGVSALWARTRSVTRRLQ